MLRRELAIVLRSPLTWLQGALSALLVGHGFVLAMDLYSSASRSVHAHTLMARELDPLLGLLRPTLGGLNLSLALLGPLVAARALAIEKERRTLHSLLLQTAAPGRLLAAKLGAAACGLGLQLATPLALSGLWLAIGGHLAPGESAVPLAGYALYALLIAALSLMAAAWTATLPQAVTLAMLLIVASWAVEASEGFAALAWLRRALAWSLSTQLAPFERAQLSLGACAALCVLIGGAFAAAWVGLHASRSRVALSASLASVVAGTALGCGLSRAVQQAFDLTENARASLPPAVVRGLRELPGSISLDVWLDLDDARRQQLERDALSKLRLALPNLVVRTPTDEREAPAELERNDGYGRIVVRVGSATRQTYSTSRRELVSLIFEAAGRTVPDFVQPEYPGYPLVVEGTRRTLVVLVAYAGLPGAFLLCGFGTTRPRRRPA